MKLIDAVKPFYFEGNYNCAESVLRGANEYYGLNLGDREMKLAAGFGAGIQTGSTCGAFLAGVSVLSMKYVPVKAHESADIKPAVTLFTEKTEKLLGSQLCREIKPKFFAEGKRCFRTVEAVCQALEETIAEYCPKV